MRILRRCFHAVQFSWRADFISWGVRAEISEHCEATERILFLNLSLWLQSRSPVRVSCSKGVEIGSKRKGRGGVSDSNFCTQQN